MTGARLERGFWGATTLTLIGAGIAIWGRARAAVPSLEAPTGAGFSLFGGELLVVLGICSWTAYSILAQRWFAPSTPQLRRTYLTTDLGPALAAAVLGHRTRHGPGGSRRTCIRRRCL